MLLATHSLSLCVCVSRSLATRVKERKEQGRKMRVLNCLLATTGSLAALFLLLHLKLSSLLELAIRSQLVIEEGNDLFRQWSDVPIGLLGYKYYFFEIVNPDEALRGAKVRVREHGPYCFK